MTEEQLREVIRKELASISKPKEKETTTEVTNEASPKYANDSAIQSLNEIIKILERVENGMKAFNQSRYSRVKGEFGKAFKSLYSLNQRLHYYVGVTENVVNEGPNYDEAMFNLDKIFGDDQESIETFQDIEDNGDWKDMVDYINNWGDEERLSDYGFRNDKHVEKLAKMIMNEKLNEKSKKWGDIAQLITKAWEESKNIPTAYAKDYAESLERMAKKNAKVFFKMYGDFTQEDFEEDMRYNLANESKVNEITLKGKDADTWIKNWGAGGRLNINNMIYKSLGKGKWKGPNGEKLSWKEVVAKASALGDERVFFEGKLNEDGTDQLAKDLETKVYDATSDGSSVKAQSTKKVWDDGVPVLKYIARAPKKSMKLPKKFRLVDDEKYGWWYFEVNGTWYGISKDDYGTPPFDY